MVIICNHVNVCLITLYNKFDTVVKEKGYLSLSLAQIKHVVSVYQKNTRACTHTLSHTHTHTHPHSHIRTHAHARIRQHAHANTFKQMTHKNTRTRTYTHPHTRTREYTHTYAQMLACTSAGIQTIIILCQSTPPDISRK